MWDLILGCRMRAIVSWINANGYEMNGMPYEIYVKTQFDKVAAEEWVTDIYFPVKRQG